MTKLGQNLKNLLNQTKLTESELARRIGVTQQVINRIVSGKNTNPKLDTLSQIASYFMVSISQLVGDESIIFEDVKLNSNHMGWNNIPFLNNEEINSKHDVKTLLTQVNTTLPTDIMSSGELFALNMDDDSMEPKFPVNSILIFNIEKQPINGDFVLLEYKNPKDIKFRQLFIKQNKPNIRCINPSHDDYRLKQLDDSCRIIGVLVQSRIYFENDII